MTKAEYYYQFKKFQQSREKYFAPVINKAIHTQYNAFIKAYQSGKNSPLLSISSQPIVTALKPLYKDSVIYAAKVRAYLVSQKSRGAIGFNELIERLLKDYFETVILNVAEDITQTTRELIQQVLANNITASFSDIVDILQSSDISRARARLIARTETVTAANQAGRFSAQQSELQMNKEWLSTMDDRTRRHHLIVNGQIVGFDDYFKLPQSITMMQPGARLQENGLSVPAKEVINCRCTTLYIPLRGGDGRLLRS